MSNELTVVPQTDRNAVDRQDHQLVKEVKQEIKNDALKHARTHVRVDEGIVTLTGKAPSLKTSVRASETACALPKPTSDSAW